MANQAGVSNLIGGVGLDGATPPNNTALYEGQKVPVTVETTGLQTAGYTEVQFYVAVDDELHPLLPNPDGVSGIAVHPDSSNQLSQSVTTDSDYQIETVIMGRAGDDATWNVSVTGGGQLALKFTPNIHYQTKMAKIDRLWGYQFLPAGQETSPNLSNSLHIQNYQVKDGNVVISGRKFSAYITLKSGSALKDLTKFNFFGKDKLPLPASVFTADKKSVWIDTDDNGALDFYITANTLADSWTLATLTMSVGTYQVDLPTLVIVNLSDIPHDAQVSGPQIEGAGSTYQVDSSHPIGVIVPSQAVTNGDIQYGDTLFLIVNGTLLPETGQVYNETNKDVITGNQPFFHISPNQLNYSLSGGANTMSYLIVRGANTPVKSSIFGFTAYGDQGNQGYNPPYPNGPTEYPNLLEVENFKPGDTINADEAAAGLTAKIDWSSWQSPPNPSDKFMIYGYIVGYDRYQDLKVPILQVETAAVTQDEIDNKGYIETPLQSPILLGWGRGPDGEKSTVVFQYYVESTQSYSKWAKTPYILATLPAGGV